MSVVVGIHSCGHDTGVAVFRDGVLEFAIETERLTRRKHDGRVQVAIEYLRHIFPDIDHEVSLVAASTNLNGRVLGMKDQDVKAAHECISKGENEFFTACSLFGRSLPCLVVAHEASHATLALHFAGWEDNTLAFVNEGNGTFSRNSAYIYRNGEITLIDRDMLPWYGTGIGWTGVSWFLGMGKSPSSAGKVMALSAFHDFDDGDLRSLLLEQPSNLQDLPDQLRFESAERVRAAAIDIVDGERLQFALPKALQHLFSECVTSEIRRLVLQTNAKNVALSGGCALNLPTNTLLRDSYPRLAIPPACNDSGHAIGAALYALQFHCAAKPRQFSVWSNGQPQSHGPTAKDERFTYRTYDSLKVARLLESGKVVAFCDSIAAIGPRSLGNRSLLASPARHGMRELVSERIKQREWFRPLAPIMTEESFRRRFPKVPPSPYMLFQYEMPDRLLPEATHVDHTARIQTIPSRGGNPRLVSLLEEFESLTGIPGLINTSLNARDKAIANTFEDVIDDFGSDVNVGAFVFGDHLLIRKH